LRADSAGMFISRNQVEWLKTDARCKKSIEWRLWSNFWQAGYSQVD
jgi:hypothetical protein